MNIAIGGKKGAGKDTAADFIMYEFQNLNKMSLSRPIKYIVSEAFSINEENLDELSFKEEKRYLFVGPFKALTILRLINQLNNDTYKETLSINIKFEIYKKLIFKSFYSYRNILQYIGTEICRKNLNKDIFIDNLLIKKQIYNSIGQYVLVSDVRFKNELDKLSKSNFFTILVKRYNQFSTKDYHESENSLPDEDEFDFVIHNSGPMQTYLSSIYSVLEIIKDVDGKWSI